MDTRYGIVYKQQSRDMYTSIDFASPCFADNLQQTKTFSHS